MKKVVFSITNVKDKNGPTFLNDFYLLLITFYDNKFTLYTISIFRGLPVAFG